VFYIRDKYSNSSLEEETKYYNIVKDITISEELYDSLFKILTYDYFTLHLDEDKRELFYIFSTLFTSLLKIKDSLLVNKDSTLTNPTIIFFYINCLDKNTKEIRDLLSIGKLTSIIVYNSRLITISYYYYKTILEEEGEEIENIGEDISIEEFIPLYLTNISRNYLEFILTIAPYLLALSKESISINGLIGELRPNIILYNNIEYPISKI
jgi:hypothetical protein